MEETKLGKLVIPNEHEPFGCGADPSGQRHFSLPLANTSTCIPSGQRQEWALLGRPMHRNGQLLVALLEHELFP